VKIDIITTNDEFENIKEEWDDLLVRSGGNIFQTWEWQWTWWKHYSKGKRLFILIGREGGVVGIAPFYLSKSHFGLPVKVLSFLGTGPSDYGGIIVLPKRKEEFIKRALSYISSFSNAWDIIDMQQLPENSSCTRFPEGLFKEDGFRYLKLFQDSLPALLLPSTWDEFTSRLSKKFRYNLGYYSRSIRKAHEVDIYSLSEGIKDISCEMNIFFDLHQKRWRAKKLPGLFWSKRYRDFHLDVADRFCKKGWLALYFLKLDGEVAASLYGFKYNNCFYYYLGGFNPQWNHLSVGTILTGEVIHDSISEKLSYFDFLRGDEDYKFKWGAVPRKNFRLLFYKEECSNRICSITNLTMKLLNCENELYKEAKKKLRAI